MLVTEIVKYTESKSKIYIDYEFAFVLYKGDIHKYGLEEGQKISVEAYEEIMTALLPKRAKLRAMNLLKSRDYTAFLLRNKLRQNFYPEEIVEETVAMMMDYGYVDDERYAIDFIRTTAHKKSRGKMLLDLKNKGISEGIAQRALVICEEDSFLEEEKEQIDRLLEKRNFDKTTADQKELQKIYAYLMRKGFSAENVSRAIFS